MTKKYTTNYNFVKPPFAAETWHDDINGNFDSIDLIIKQATNATSNIGDWANSTSYVVGNRVRDSSDNTYYDCLVAHTSASSGIMSLDRAANPSYWVLVANGWSVKGEWQNDTAYNIGDLAFDSSDNLYKICTVAHTSASSPATLRDDTTNWAIMIDGQAAMTAAADADNINTGKVGYDYLSDQVRMHWETADTSTDFDSLTASGWQPNAYRGDNPNGPSTSGEWFIVRTTTNNAGNVTTQYAFPLYAGDARRIYVRSYQSSAWVAWRSYATFEEIEAEFVDLTNAQTIAGAKIFSDGITFSSAAIFSSTLAVTGAITTDDVANVKGGTVSIWAASATSNAHLYMKDDTGQQRGLFYWSYSTDRLIFQVYDNSGTLIGTALQYDGTDLIIGSDKFLKDGTSTTLTVGYVSTAYNAGTKSSGTFTPDPAQGNLQYAVNGGAHTLAAPTATGDFSIVIQYTNNGSAGAITLTGWSRTGGDTLTTTNGDDFLFHIIKLNGFTRLHIEALQ